jgi:hypothetical protein
MLSSMIVWNDRA